MEGRPPAKASIRFVPQGPLSPAMKSAIRSHAMLDTRRKQRHQRMSNLQSSKLPRLTRGPFEDTLCKCETRYMADQTDSIATTTLVMPRSNGPSQQLAETLKICPKCRLVQFSRLSEPAQLGVAKAEPGVSAFLQLDWDPFNTLPNLPSKLSQQQSREMNELKSHIITFFTPGVLKNILLPILTKEPAMFLGMLYMRCAYLSAVKGHGESSLARAIKQEAIRQINYRISDQTKANTTVTISAIGFLSCGVGNFGHPSAAAEVEAHEEGIQRLLYRGPTWTPPEADTLGRTLVKLLAVHQLLHSVMAFAPVDDQLLMIYGRPTRPISDLEFIPESPLFCPRTDFYSIRTSPGCNENTLQLLRVVRDLTQTRLVMDSTKLEERKETLLVRYRAIKSALSALISATHTNKTFGNAEYECCRQAASMMITALETSTPFKSLDIRMIEELVLALQKTDIGNCWGLMLGVLLWISLIGVTAAIEKP